MGAVGIYARISQDVDGEGAGVRRQEQLCRRYAEVEWPGTPIEVYVDNDLSGATDERPGYRRLLEHVRAGRISELVVAEQSRLTRDVVEWDRLSVVLTAAGIEKVHTLNGGRVSVGPGGGRLVGRIMAAVNAEERDQTIERIHRALEENARNGSPAGGGGYGYRTSGQRGAKTLVIERQEADVILGIVDRVERGEPLAAVVDWLNSSGIPSSRGKPWSTQSVRSVVLKPTIAGLRVHRGEIVGPGNWTPIVDEDRWRALNLKLSGIRLVTSADGRTRKVSPGRRRPRRRLLTGGLSTCGKCGGPLAATSQYRRTEQVPAYGCHPKGSPDACMGVSIAADLLEQAVSDTVLFRLGSPEARALLRPPPSGEADAIARDLGEVEDLLEELGGMLGRGELDVVSFRSASDAARSRVDVLRRSLAAASVPPIDDEPETLAERWPDLPIEARRRIVEELVELVIVSPATQRGPYFDPERVKIRWRA